MYSIFRQSQSILLLLYILFVNRNSPKLPNNGEMRENWKIRASWCHVCANRHSSCVMGATLAPTGTIIQTKNDGFSRYHPLFYKFGAALLFIYILTTSTQNSSLIGWGIRLQIPKKCAISLKMADIVKYLLLKAILNCQTYTDD